MSIARIIRIAAATTALSGVFITAAKADPVADFYKGQQFTIMVGHHPGTGFDIYSRVLARHMGKHIPGEPSFVVKNMAGASGVIAANWLYTSAPKDGATMGIFAHTVALENMFGNEQARFDASKFIWVGNMEKSVGVCGVSPKAGVSTFEDLRNKPVRFGGTGATGPLVTLANAAKNLLGAKITVIPGYKGALDVKAAMHRDEVSGVCGLFWSHVISAWKDDLDSGAFKPILFVSGERPENMKNVAHVDDFVKTDEDRALFGLVFNISEHGRNYAMPPGVPEERVRAVRKAFMDTMKEPAFLAEAGKLGVEVSPSSGEEVEKAWRGYTATPPAIIARAKAALLTP